MSKIREIVEGHINEARSLTGTGNELVEQMSIVRSNICNACPLKKGNTCNPNLYLRPEDMDVSNTPKEGYFVGCGCRLSAKQKSRNSRCPAGLWEKY